MAVPQSSFRFMARDLFTSATVLPTAVVLETTCYHNWSDFRATFQTVLAAINSLSPLQGIERIGLRYINEIRLDGAPTGLEPWRAAVAPEALAAHDLAESLAGHRVKQGFTQSVIGVSETTTITFRHGLLEGFSVGEGPLKLPTPLRNGPYYLVDVDSSLTVPEPLPPFDELTAFAFADQLHEPVRAIFQGLVAPAFRVDTNQAGTE